jgi:hypothetical protein
MTHNVTLYLVEILRTSDQLFAETSIWKNTSQQHTDNPALPVGFEHKIPEGERLQTYAFDREATGIDI